MLKETLEKIANNDLNLARKNGGCVVGSTKAGNIELKHNEGIYTATNFNTGVEYVTGAKKAVREFLVNQYDVIIDY